MSSWCHGALCRIRKIWNNSNWEGRRCAQRKTWRIPSMILTFCSALKRRRNQFISSAAQCHSWVSIPNGNETSKSMFSPRIREKKKPCTKKRKKTRQFEISRSIPSLTFLFYSGGSIFRSISFSFLFISCLWYSFLSQSRVIHILHVRKGAKRPVLDPWQQEDALT